MVVKGVNRGEVEELRPGAVFIFIGLLPNTGFLGGVFAAGDARSGSTNQVASAVGEGATAALMIRQFLEKSQGSRGYMGD